MNKLKVSLRGEVAPFQASLKVYFMMLNLPRCFQHFKNINATFKNWEGQWCLG